VEQPNKDALHMFAFLAYSIKEMIARGAKIQFNHMKS